MSLSTESGPREYRIDELARAAGTTVRNVRSYQDRGLLAPPRRSGRVGLYSEGHLARLRLVGSLLDRGYTLANIGELVAAWERGQDVAAMLGLEAALGGATPPGTVVTAADMAEVFGDGLAPFLEEAVAIGLLTPEGPSGSYRVQDPVALEVGRVLVDAGVPLPAVLATARAMRADMDHVARSFVALVESHLVEPLGDPMPAADARRLATLVSQLRPLAAQLVAAEVSLAMDREIQRRLGEHLARLAGLGEAVSRPGRAPE